MNHCVPDFEIDMDDDEYPTPMSSAFPRPKKPLPDDGIMELFWQNGPVVMQSQNQRPHRKPPPVRNASDVIPSRPSTAREIEIRPSKQVENYNNQHLFMQEDEMTSWLHYPIVDDSPLDHNFCADLLYPPTVTINNNNQINNSTTMQTNVRTSQLTDLRQPSTLMAPTRPPIPPSRRPETKTHESVHMSEHNARVEPGPSSSRTAAKESTMVDSCDTPAAAAAAAASRVSETVRSSAEPTEGDACRGSMSTIGVAAPSTTPAGGRMGAAMCEMTVTSSPGGSSGSAEPPHRSPAEDRKRKGRETDDSECHSEDMDYESAETKRKVRGAKSTKRSRAAEVHNLSERRRRDRINEKMRALQELIPRCNKSDKASMLDEAIEYLKSLQLQVQMMSMGCGMMPMMYPGMQQYMPAMGMGMGMEMGMNRAVMPFPNMLAAASALPAATAAAHLGPRFSVPPFHMPHVAAPDLSRMQAANQSDNVLPSLATSDPAHSRIPKLTDPYHQYLGPHHMQLQLMQNQTMIQQNVSKPSTSKGHENPENHQPGKYS